MIKTKSQNTLALLLKEKGILRIRLAKELKVSIHSINAWCSNARQFDYKTAYAIRDILGLDSIERLIEEDL